MNLHMDLMEPLAVAAFVASIYAWKQRVRPRTSGFVLDVGMNAGIYTWLASAIAPELKVIGVDMQPRCVDIAECGLRLLHNGAWPDNVRLFRRYVSAGSSGDATLNVPDNQCGVMVSPTAVGGRTPAGKAQRWERVSNATTRSVRPIALGEHLLKHVDSGSRAAVVKIVRRAAVSEPVMGS